MPVLRVDVDQETLTEEGSRGCERGCRVRRRWEWGVGGKRSGKRHKGEPAKPRAKRTKERSGKRKGAKGEEMAKEDRVEEPMKERMFVTTDEQSRLKVLPVRARATQHNKESGASANANHQLYEIQSPLHQAEVPSPPPRPTPAKPMVARRILPQTDSNIHTAQPLVRHPQSMPDTLSISATQRGTLRDLLAHQHAPSHMVSSPPVRFSGAATIGQYIVFVGIRYKHVRCTNSKLRVLYTHDPPAK